MNAQKGTRIFDDKTIFSDMMHVDTISTSNIPYSTHFGGYNSSMTTKRSLSIASKCIH